MRHKSQAFVIQAVQFQSTHPLRDATLLILSITSITLISIHAPLTGCDGNVGYDGIRKRYFNPRTPYGMRHTWTHRVRILLGISIHAPLTGCDHSATFLGLLNILFQSTHPLRDATCASSFFRLQICNFNPRTPYGMRLIMTFQGSFV